MRVLKFGGSSVATAARLGAVADIVAGAASRDRIVVVVSALAGVTDPLLRLADTAATGGRAWEPGALVLAQRHLDCLRELGGSPAGEAAMRAVLHELAASLAAIAAARAVCAERRDGVLSAGERLAVHLAAQALRRRGLAATALDARELIVTDSAFGGAEPDQAATAARARALLGDRSAGSIPVVTGFIGADPSGRTTTLGRGGSDLTAAILGAVLGARAVEIWTDVDGVLAACPRQVPHAGTLARLTYAEAEALARFGAKVLYPKTMAPPARLGIPILVRNTFAPRGPHTVVAAAVGRPAGRPRAVTSADGGVLVAAPFPVALAERLRDIGVTLQACRAAALPGGAALASGAAAGVVRAALAEAPAGAAVRVRDGLGVVAVVGEGLGNNDLATGQARQVLAAARIPVLAEVETGSRAALALVVQRGHLGEAVWVLHEALLRPRGAVPAGRIAAPAAAGR